METRYPTESFLATPRRWCCRRSAKRSNLTLAGTFQSGMNDQATPRAGYDKKLALRASIAFIVVCVLYGGAKGFLESYYAAKDPVKVRATAKASGIKGCIATAQQTAAQVAQYCDCAINKSIDSFSDDELKVVAHRTKDTLTPGREGALHECHGCLQPGTPRGSHYRSTGGGTDGSRCSSLTRSLSLRPFAAGIRA